MPRAVLKVAARNGSRWDPAAGRWQHPGEEIVVESDDQGEFERQLYLHAAHCDLLEGEVPKTMGQNPSFLARVRTKAAGAVKKASGKLEEFESLAELRAGKKKDSPEVQATGKTCGECGQTFKSIGALTRHLKRSGHSE